MGIPKAAGEPEKPTGKKGWKDRPLSQRAHAKEGYNSRYERRQVAQGKTVKMIACVVAVRRFSLPRAPMRYPCLLPLTSCTCARTE